MSVRPCPGPHWRDPEPPLTSLPLCEGCQARLVSAVGELPELYVHAYLALEPGRRGTERVSGSRTPPVPLAVDADALLARILLVATSWAELVRRARGLTAPAPRRVETVRIRHTWAPVVERVEHPAGGVPAVRIAHHERRHRAEAVQAPADGTSGVTLTAACRVLAAHVETLLALPSASLWRWDDAREAWLTVDLDGVGGALELLDLHRDARSLLGQTRSRDRLRGVECPNDECRQRTLVREHGSELVQCESCSGVWPREQLDRWVRMLAGDARQRKAGNG